MQNRDILLIQIKQIGKAIRRLLSGFRNAEIIHSKKSIADTNDKFKSDVSLDINLLLKTEKSTFKDFFSTINFTLNHAELVSDYLVELAISSDNNVKNTYLIKAFEILEYISIESKSVSFSRMQKEDVIKQMMKE